jgi:hypothetical protein
MKLRQYILACTALALAMGSIAYFGVRPEQRNLDGTEQATAGAGPAAAERTGRPALSAPLGHGIALQLPAQTGAGRLDPGLRAIAAHTPQSLARARDTMNFLPDYVTDTTGTELMVEFVGRDTAATGLAIEQLKAAGLHGVRHQGRLAAGWMPIASLRALEANPHLLLARALPKLHANLGVAVNQGDVAMLSDQVRARYGVDGKGVKIGILSTSFNLSGGMNASIAAGDLPGPGNPNGYTQPVTIIEESPAGLFPPSNLDEGRAMAELVHDIAPGAQLLFSGMRGGSSLDLADAMERLAQAGAEIIVDDIAVSPSPFFQDDVAARKIDELTARGIHYFVAAGNYRAFDTYELPWTTFDVFNAQDYETFDFDPTPELVRPVLTVRPSAGAGTYSGVLNFQWDEPWASHSIGGAGAANTLLMLVLTPDNRLLLATPSVVGADPVFGLRFNNISAEEFPSLNIAVLKPKDGRRAPGRVKFTLNLTGAAVDAVRPLPYGTIAGHQNARSAFVIGASSWFNTPLGAPIWNRDFDNLPTPDGNTLTSTPVPATPILSYLGGPSVLFRGDNGANVITGSKVGLQPILFDSTGARLAVPEIRRNPALVAVDGVQNSFFGFQIGNASTPPLFFGTSAAAPNAGAVAALLLQASRKTLTREGLYNALTRTAQDMDDPYDAGLQTDASDPLFARGYDRASGHGLVQALPALEQVIADVGADDLRVSWECQTGDARRWRIDNPNGFGILADLSANAGIRLPGETDFGQPERSGVLIPPGGLTFETPQSRFSRLSSVYLGWRLFGNTVGSASSLKIGAWPSCS